MFDTLLESRARRRRRPGVVAASATAHAMMIAAAVWATAGAEPGPDTPRDADVVYVPMPERPPEPIAQPRPASPSTATAPADAPSLPVIDVPTTIPDGIPDVDPTRVMPDAEAFRRGDVLFRPGERVSPGPGTVPGPVASGNEPADRASVDREVVPRADNPAPRYPDMLRAAGVEGGVSVRFVVDTLGRVEPASVQVLQTDHAAFAEAVRLALSRARYSPAELQGRKVRQLVEQRFGFVLER